MAGTTFRQFEAMVAGSGNQLHPVFQSLNPGGSTRSLPGEWYQAVYLAGSVLAYDNDAGLADQSIPIEFLGDDASLAAMTLHGIVNASIDRDPATPADMTFQGFSPPRVSRCGDMERYMAETIENLTEPERESPYGYTVVTAQGKPVAVQSLRGNVSGVLSFKRAYVEGISYPAGSLFAARFPADFRRRGETHKQLVSEGPGVIDYRFIRLMPWALPANIREQEFPVIMAENASPLIHDASVAEVAYIAERAIQGRPVAQAA